MVKSAMFSECGKYRYLLTRIWNESLPVAMCIGLNPSTANAESDDPTILNLKRLLAFNGFGGLHMNNLFALISAYPDALRSCADPLKDNDTWLWLTEERSKVVIFCWGNFKQANYRANKIESIIKNAMCFGKNKNGSPKHPLYLKSNTALMNFN